LIGGWVGHSASLGAVAKRESSSLPGIVTWPFSHYTDWATRSLLAWD